MAAANPNLLPMRASELRFSRLRAQRLLPGSEAAGAVEASAAVCGLQAQDAPSAALSVRARTSGLTVADVVAAREDRSLVRTWAMRGTLHLLPAEDVAWVVALVAPPVLPVHRLWFERMGHRIDVDRVLDEAVEALERDGPLTRHELAERLGRPDEGGLAAALARLGSLEARVVCGPERGAEPTYVGIERWLGRRRSSAPSDPLGELARRYVRGHAPASPADFASWSGLGQRAARSAFEAVADQPAKEDEPPPAERFVRLVPRWDSVLLGWNGREWLVPREHASRVLPGGGYLHAVVLVDGVAAGTWKLDKRQQLRVDWFGAEPRGVRRALAAEEADLLRFLGDRPA
jgi:Winged helix DNA-binding domain